MATLLVIAGPAKGKTLAIEREVVIGRYDADLSIDDPQMSRRHAAVRPQRSALVVEDLGSTNGTRVDGLRIDGPVTVTNVAVIQLGDTEIALDAGPPPARMSAEPARAGERPTRPHAAAPKRRGPPLYAERSLLGKLTFGLIGPVLAGIASGFLFDVSAELFLIATVAGLAATYLGGLEHADIGEGALRGLIGGGSFGFAFVITQELIGADAVVSLPEPLMVFPFLTGFGAMPIGAAGALVRAGKESPATAQADLSFFKLGLIGALVAAPLGAFAQILHPLPDPGDGNPRAFLETIVPSDEWIYVHLLSIVAYIVSVPAFAALWRSYREGASRWLAGYGFLFAMIGIAVGIVWVVIDGLAIKDTADAWASASGARQLAIEEAAIAIEEVILAFFSVSMIVFFGVMFLFYGLAALRARFDPTWLSLFVIGAACLNIVTGTIQAFTDRTEIVTHVMVPIGVVAANVYIPIALLLMWRRVSVSGMPGSAAV